MPNARWNNQVISCLLGEADSWNVNMLFVINKMTLISLIRCPLIHLHILHQYYFTSASQSCSSEKLQLARIFSFKPSNISLLQWQHNNRNRSIFVTISLRSRKQAAIHHYYTCHWHLCTSRA